MQLQPASTPQESQRRTLRYHLAPGLELGPQQFQTDLHRQAARGTVCQFARHVLSAAETRTFPVKTDAEARRSYGAGRLATAEQVGDGRQCALREPPSCGVRHIGPCHSH
jgi:hypothetical protein